MEKEFECPGRGKIQCSSCLELANIAFGYTFAKNRTPTQAEIFETEQAQNDIRARVQTAGITSLPCATRRQLAVDIGADVGREYRERHDT